MTPPNRLLEAERALTYILGRKEFADGTEILLPALAYLREKKKQTSKGSTAVGLQTRLENV